MLEIIQVEEKISGNLKAHGLLRNLVGKNTLLALSGGTSPDYKRLIVNVGDIVPGAACMTDERFGTPGHENSNEFVFRNFGLTEFFRMRDIKFYRILCGQGFDETAVDYNRTIFDLFRQIPKKVGIMGIGANLHTAGIFPNSEAIRSDKLVVSETVDDRFQKRVTLTLNALGKFTSFIILMFGEEKREALKIMLDENQQDVEKYPAVFYRISHIKSYLITDINI
jgi:6-phosphogluconolactonase/glucosamine-6-phosphate isomerase/deaminase